MDGTVDEGALRLLRHGRCRDVFVLERFGYVLEMQEARWEPESNGREFDVSKTELGELMPAMYGLVQASHQGEMFSVLISERVVCDFNDFMLKFTATSPQPHRSGECSASTLPSSL